MESLWGEVSQTCPCQDIFIVLLIFVFFYCGYYFIYLLVMGSSTHVLHLFVCWIVKILLYRVVGKLFHCAFDA